MSILAEVPIEDRVPAGAVVRVTGEGEGDGWDAIVGREYLVEAYVPIEEGDAEPPQPYYMLAELGEFGNQYFANAHQVVLVRSVEEQDERMKDAEPGEIIRMIADGIIQGRHDGLEVYETTILLTEPEKGGAESANGYEYGVEFVGRREGGARFAGTIRLTSLYRADF